MSELASPKAPIVFAGQTLCSPECLATMLKECLIQEKRVSESSLGARPLMLIGQILMDQGSITASQLERALQAHRSSGKLLGECLMTQMLLSEEDLTAALSIQSYCPVYRAGTFVPERMTKFLPRALVESFGALPLRVSHNPDRLMIGFADRLDYRLISACERMHGIDVDGGLLVPREVQKVKSGLLESDFAPCRMVLARSRQAKIEGMSRAILDHAAHDARLVYVRGYFWLRMWTGSKDMHGEKSQPNDLLCKLCGPDASVLDSVDSDELW
jgi:hypothetical protein